VAITKNPQSSLAKAGDVLLRLPNTPEACPLGLAPTSSTTATLVLGDVLTMALMRRKHFTKDDFNQRHPGGKLGAALLKVADLMHSGKKMPLLKEDALMHEILLEMTSKRLGCVGFTDKKGNLSGIFTDGDLRRALPSGRDVLKDNARKLMTKNPKTIAPAAFAAQAVKIMNDKKITNLFVVEKGKPLGVIHIHDCLAKGII
jgi:arabinose-5-phosphate isomerase